MRVLALRRPMLVFAAMSLLLGAGRPRPAMGQAPGTAVYTLAQADSGRVLFEATCAACHEVDLTGGEGPPLVGAPFAYKWDGQSVRGLIRFVTVNMPMSDPGTLTEQLATLAVAYILASNGLPAGPIPLAATSTGRVDIPPDH